MKRTKRILVLMIMLVLATVSVKAADATATANLKADKEQVKAGDQFKITLEGICEAGINGLTAEITYEEDKVELVSVEAADGKWYNFGSDKKIEIASTSSDDIKTADIVKITFKVKDGVEEGTKVKVGVKDIVLDSNEATNSSKEIGTKEKEITVVKETQDPGTQDPGTQDPGTQDPGTQDPGTQDPGTQDPGTQDPGTQDPGTQDPGTQDPGTQDPGTQDPGTQDPGTQNPGTQDPGGNKPQPDKDGTESDKDIPNTGVENLIIPAAIIAIMGVVGYVGYRKNNI